MLYISCSLCALDACQHDNHVQRNSPKTFTGDYPKINPTVSNKCSHPSTKIIKLTYTGTYSVSYIMYIRIGQYIC